MGRDDHLIDLAQTTAILIMIVVLIGAIVMQIYLARMLRHGGRNSHDKALNDVLKGQDKIFESIHKLWGRIDEIEMRQGVRGDLDPLRRFMKLSDALAKALKDEEQPPSPPSP